MQPTVSCLLPLRLDKKKKSVTLPGTKTELTMENNGEIILYQPDNEVKLEVRLEEETVWLTQEQIATLFGTKRPAITKHLSNIYNSGELAQDSTCSILEHMGNDGKQKYVTKYYNLDAILSVGYRVNSKNATLFRRWANKVLKEYLLKHNSQYPPISIHTCKKSHDRFLIIDGVEVWHIGASLKDLGKKMFAFSKLGIPAEAVTILL